MRDIQDLNNSSEWPSLLKRCEKTWESHSPDEGDVCSHTDREMRATAQDTAGWGMQSVSVSNLTPSPPWPASRHANLCSVDLDLYPGAVMDTGRAKRKNILGFKTQILVCGV